MSSPNPFHLPEGTTNRDGRQLRAPQSATNLSYPYISRLTTIVLQRGGARFRVHPYSAAHERLTGNVPESPLSIRTRVAQSRLTSADSLEARQQTISAGEYIRPAKFSSH